LSRCSIVGNLASATRALVRVDWNSDAVKHIDAVCSSVVVHPSGRSPFIFDGLFFEEVDDLFEAIDYCFEFGDRFCG